MTRLELRGVTIRLGAGTSALTAVDGIDLTLEPGEAVGLVGETGAGKSTLARGVVRLHPISTGRILLDGVDVTTARGHVLREYRHRVQMVFQDPFSSLNPRMRVGTLITEAAAAHRRYSPRELRAELDRALSLVALDTAIADRFPHELSGGQRQRVAIARALAVHPEVVVLDEVTSALDVSVQATVLNLLMDLQRTLGLSYLLISHDLSVVRHVCSTIAVMYLGRLVEAGSTDLVFAAPRHPYTQALLDSIPALRSGRIRTGLTVLGEMPDPRQPPPGCRFHPRCPIGPRSHPERTVCSELDPELVEVDAPDGTVRAAACHFPLTLGRGATQGPATHTWPPPGDTG